MAEAKENKSVSTSAKEYLRGISGGLLFSTPLLYTMEVWWHGFIAPGWKVIIFIVFTFFLLIVYNRFSGIKQDAKWNEITSDAVEELGLGLLLASAILFMLYRIRAGEMPLQEIIGKISVEALFISIGISIGKAQLGSEKSGNKDNKSQGESRTKTIIFLIVISLCGSVVVGSSVAPTQEVLILAVEARPAHILSIILFSILLSIVIIFFSDIKGSPDKPKSGMVYNITLFTCTSYCCALATSAFLLWFFGRFENIGLQVIIYQIIVLGLPSSIGASAGRLLIK